MIIYSIFNVINYTHPAYFVINKIQFWANDHD